MKMKNAVCLVLVVLVILFASAIPGYTVDRGASHGGGGPHGGGDGRGGGDGMVEAMAWWRRGMAEAIGMAEVITMAEAIGMAVSGSGPDGVDGGSVVDGVPRTIRIMIHIIHTIGKHPRSSNSSLRYMSSRRNSIGISAGIPRGTIRT